MMDTSDQAIVKALRRLTFAVWALVLVVAIFISMYLVAYIPWFRFAWNSVDSPTPTQSSGKFSAPPQYERFYDLSPEKQIEAASVIAIARYQRDGERLRCVISEILKRSPKTDFYFDVGDEYPHCSRYPEANKSYGDGQLLFFVGSPAEFRYSTSFEADRLRGLGDMPIELLRAKIREAAR